MSLKCLFGHKWNGCRCTNCGTKRDEGHDWKGCKCLKCGITRDLGHLPENGKCKICGIKMLKVDFTLDELTQATEIMRLTLEFAKKQDNSVIEEHAQWVAKLLSDAKDVGYAWMSQGYIGIIRTCTAHGDKMGLDPQKLVTEYAGLFSKLFTLSMLPYWKER